jgi:hypothetical protein
MDNRILMDNDPEYVECWLGVVRAVALRSGWRVIGMRLWVRILGKLTEKHVIEPFTIPDSWMRFAVMIGVRVLRLCINGLL